MSRFVVIFAIVILAVMAYFNAQYAFNNKSENKDQSRDILPDIPAFTSGTPNVEMPPVHISGNDWTTKLDKGDFTQIQIPKDKQKQYNSILKNLIDDWKTNKIKEMIDNGELIPETDFDSFARTIEIPADEINKLENQALKQLNKEK